MSRELHHFSLWDYVVFTLLLVVSTIIGIYFGFCRAKTIQNTNDFLMAGRSMQVIPVALSMLASFMSAIMLLGTPAEIFTYGTEYMMIGFAYCLVMPAAAYLYLPIFYKLHLTSAYEYLELRFRSKALRLIGTMAFIIQMMLYMAIVLYAPSLALNAVTGFNVWAAVLSVGCVCIFYTSLGGMKAVMWTDVFQIVIMIVGLIAVIVRGVVINGGVWNVWEQAQKGGRIHFLDFNPDPSERHSTFSLVVGGLFTWLAIYGCNQSQVQRALTVPTLKGAQIALLLNIPGLSLLLLLTSCCGLVMYAHYRDCDPMANQDIQARDQLMPLFVMDTLHVIPGLPGLFTACLFSGALSSVSSGLNSLAAVTLQDFIRGWLWPDITEYRATQLSKGLAFTYGIFMIALTFVASHLGDVLQASLGLFGIIGGPLLGLFTLGLFFPCANWKGAIIGFISGIGILIWIGVGGILHKPVAPGSHILPYSTDNCPITNSTDVLYSSLDEHSTITDGITVLYTYANTTQGGYTAAAKIIDDDRSLLMRLYGTSYLLLSVLAVLIVVLVGLIISFITGCTPADQLDDRTVLPLSKMLCCCLPETWHNKLGCIQTYDIEVNRDDKHLSEEKGQAHSYNYNKPMTEMKTRDKQLTENAPLMKKKK